MIDPSRVEPIRLLDEVELSPRLRELRLHSRALDAETSVRVLTPSGPPRTGLPVLWLLHGGDDDFRSWTDSGGAEQLTDDLDLLVVMPDTGPGGWYTDWFRTDSAAGPQQWETYHLWELRPWIEQRYATRTDRSGRAIAGLSMGGYGTMVYAARHPDLFVHAAAYSAAVDIVDPHLGLFADALAMLNGGEPGCIWGDRELELENWRAHNPVDLAANLATLSLELRTGNGQPGGRHGGDPDLIETTVHQTSTTLHRTLDGLGIEHVWDDYGPGAHLWPYWHDDLAATLPIVMAAFGRATFDDPSAVEHGAVEHGAIEHTAYEPSFDVWGWSVRLERTHLAATKVELAHDHLVVRSLDTGTVTTPPWHTPGEPVVVTTSAGEQHIVADHDGRLRIDVVAVPGDTTSFDTTSRHTTSFDTTAFRAEWE